MQSDVMQTMLLTTGLTFIGFLLVFLGLSLGWLFKKKPLKGSCGGLNALGLKGECQICGAKLDSPKPSGSSTASARKESCLR